MAHMRAHKAVAVVAAVGEGEWRESVQKYVTSVYDT
jgi:hypothetical protein